MEWHKFIADKSIRDIVRLDRNNLLYIIIITDNVY